MHHGQRRNFQLGQVVHQLRQFPGVVQIGVVIEFGRLLHPRQVGAGTEMLATSAHQQKAQAGVGRDLVQREDQLTDHLGVERVVLFFPAEPQSRETTRVGLQFEGVEVAHIHPSPRFL
ncbi:hypothetical protein D3C84_1009970 [compost metagenome]